MGLDGHPYLSCSDLKDLHYNVMIVDARRGEVLERWEEYEVESRDPIHRHGDGRYYWKPIFQEIGHASPAGDLWLRLHISWRDDDMVSEASSSSSPSSGGADGQQLHVRKRKSVLTCRARVDYEGGCYECGTRSEMLGVGDVWVAFTYGCLP